MSQHLIELKCPGCGAPYFTGFSNLRETNSNNENSVIDNSWSDDEWLETNPDNENFVIDND